MPWTEIECLFGGTMFEDGLDALRKEMSFNEIMRLIERTARWVAPETFKRLPVWYPEYARQGRLYNANWTVPRPHKKQATGESSHKQEGNTNANKALTQALGLRGKERPNWSCCHIWGLDDAKFQTSNLIVKDRKYFSCVGNMVLLPTPLKAFTDAMPEVKMLLRVCVSHLYGWTCEHEAARVAAQAIAQWNCWEGYPQSWPTPQRKSLPLGTIPLSTRIEEAVNRRLNAIRNDLKNAGSEYPRLEVLDTLEFWKIKI